MIPNAGAAWPGGTWSVIGPGSVGGLACGGAAFGPTIPEYQGYRVETRNLKVEKEK